MWPKFLELNLVTVSDRWHIFRLISDLKGYISYEAMHYCICGMHVFCKRCWALCVKNLVKITICALGAMTMGDQRGQIS